MPLLITFLLSSAIQASYTTNSSFLQFIFLNLMFSIPNSSIWISAASLRLLMASLQFLFKFFTFITSLLNYTQLDYFMSFLRNLCLRKQVAGIYPGIRNCECINYGGTINRISRLK